jgi:phenylacetate-coenzyme A ligase PaaK-like adenylate-forming protein
MGKLHQNSEFCRVDFQPLKPEYGGLLTGRLLVTPFRNPWSMMLRFDTGDIVSVDETGQCPCGRNSGLILSSINGRRVNLTLSAGGRPVTLSELDNAIAALDDIEEYKLVQMDSARFDFQVVTPAQDRSALEDNVLNILKNIYGDDAVIRIRYRKAIPPGVSGKYLISQAGFSIDLEKYLVGRDVGGSGTAAEKSRDE